jgi:serine/threonine-protein kinase RIM15
LLASSDWGVFREATLRLQEDDSHTVEVRFRLQVEPEDERDLSAGVLYQQMEGKGMLMVDREDGQPSHTMWVIKPIAPARYESEDETFALETGEVGDSYSEVGDRSFANRSAFDPITPFPFNQPISVEPILCRICECQIPQWYFEKHSETCVEVHRLEAEIAECNESISELRNTIRDLMTAVDQSSPVVIPEYRGMPIFSPSTSPSISSPMQLFRSSKIQRMSVKKMQGRLLEQLEDILQVASDVSMPSLKDEESKEPIERQRLLSPGSEGKITQVRNWCKPTIEDAALCQLVQDAERVMRQKVDNVVRMQNTIRYSEKIWREWEEKVGESLAASRESEAADSDEGDDNESGEEEDHSSTTSEYVLPDAPSSEPTPMASSSPVPFTAGSRVSSSSVIAPAPVPIARQLQTRSSTPSSISSPLALAEPIVASSSYDTPPPMTLDDIPGSLTIKTRRSMQNVLEPRLLVTPPHSPLVSPRDIPTSRRGHRRQSTAANPFFSPTIAPLNAPLSPRQPSSAPLSRTMPTSIKDFDVIKPISKGAFGSVFLAKKKATGDYYAIKVLKKADMIAKNQITNVKAERTILMKQAESPFVAKLYFTFQSKENLYLVMEYLNGGDCAALIKSLGSLPEEWTKNYIAEVVLGLEYLHQRGVVHR